MVLYHSLPISDQSYKKLLRLAKLRQVKPEELLDRLIAESEGDVTDHQKNNPTYDSEIEAMGKEEVAFKEQLQELKKKYLDQFVAIHQGTVIDHDRDKMALYKRIDATYPNKVVLIRQVLKQVEEERVYYVRSPRIIRN